jgi:hypothetical protein
VEGVFQLGVCTSVPSDCVCSGRQTRCAPPSAFPHADNAKISDVPPSIGEDNALHKIGTLEADHPDSPLSSLHRSMQESAQKAHEGKIAIYGLVVETHILSIE